MKQLYVSELFFRAVYGMSKWQKMMLVIFFFCERNVPWHDLLHKDALLRRAHVRSSRTLRTHRPEVPRFTYCKIGGSFLSFLYR